MTFQTGARLGPYEILEPLGVGGMGEVYKARDTRLDRLVAIKVLLPNVGANQQFRMRFEREARAASALDHPHICTIYDVGSTEITPYLVMQYVQGETLASRISSSSLPVSEALEYAVQIASGLAAAHRSGIVHRDLKPANVMVATDGTIKILDFGLAKLVESDAAMALHETRTSADATQAGTVIGTSGYMSPEQVEGRQVDSRSDVFSFGVLLYELLTRRRPFDRGSVVSTALAIVREPPAPPRGIRHEIPHDLESVMLRCLEKTPDARFASGTDLHEQLLSCRSHLAVATDKYATGSRRGRHLAAAVLVLAAVIVLALGWGAMSRSRIQRSLEQSLPEIARLSEHGQYAAAYALAVEIARNVPDNRRLDELMREITTEVSVETQPADAEIWIAEYSDTNSASQPLGRSPIRGVRVPRGLKRWTITKPGFRTVDAALSPEADGPTLSFDLHPEDSIPVGMVRVPKGITNRGLTGLDHLDLATVEDFFIDRHEVTNREFAEFVRSGGYRKPEYWKQPFSKDGRVIPFEEAMTPLRDLTGRPGPATWELGSFPTGQDDLPVAGVSWYEAAAFASFAGKDLPTVDQWQRAAFRSSFMQNGFPLLRLSNFGERSVKVGSRQALNPYGTFDMAGNVKEWCWNASGPHSARYILGGAFGEPAYMFHDPDAQSPWNRLPSYGFRTVKNLTAPSASALAPVNYSSRDYAQEKPVSDEEFRAYRRFYVYDRTSLEARVESVDETSSFWRMEKVSFNAAYGQERITAYLLLPKNVDPPYQTVVYFPGSGVLRERSADVRLKRELSPDEPLGQGPAFLARSGRAVLYPVYKSTWERGDGLLSDRPNMTSWFRDHVIQWQKDVARSVDYLEGRPDIDTGRIGYLGYSWGSTMAPMVLALEERLKVAVLVVGGFWQQKGPPEVEQINFAPRVKVPVLMLNGRYDFVFPVDTSQVPMFRLLGTPPEHKSHVLLDSGHSVPPRALVTYAVEWFDRYFGSVR